MITGTVTAAEFQSGRRHAHNRLRPEEVRSLRIGRRLKIFAALVYADDGRFTGRASQMTGPTEAHFIGYHAARVGDERAMVVELRADARTAYSWFALPHDLELVR
jgi:hypothetical protein